MHVFSEITELSAYLLANRKDKMVGFVPTMGALHQAHLSLVEQSQAQCDITVCSIFVNPKQFNRREDLINYPKNLEKDIEMLRSVNCDVLFCPSVDEMYPDTNEKAFDFGQLTSLMEGEHRPGHFNGVAIVIERFFAIIQPEVAFFGEKDFQQLAVIKALVSQLNLPVQIVGCPTVREASGLAMSSRNERLNEAEKIAAAAIYQGLMRIAENKDKASIAELKTQFTEFIESNPMLTTEYIEIADESTLQAINTWSDSQAPRAFTAVNIRDVRLIDNLPINP